MQIEKLLQEDIAEVVAIWYEASIVAHDFISPQYWSSKRELMESRYIPMAETYVAKQGDKIAGFVSVVENYLAAIFVLPQLQGRGTGSVLLEHVKSLRDHYNLKMFARNTQSVAFYHAHGFFVVSEQIDEETQEKELVMEWHR